MKKGLLLLITGFVPVAAFAASRTERVITKSAQAVDFTQTIDLQYLKDVTVQAVYSDGTPSTSSITDGAYSSATITVANYSFLNGQASSATITLVTGKNTSAALTGAYVTINGRKYNEGSDWSRGFSSTNTMASMASAIDAHPKYAASVSSNVITVAAVSSGTFANSWTIASSTEAAISLSSTSFLTGQEFGYLTINHVTLTETTDWDAETSSDTTATNIHTAINNDSTLNAITSASIQDLGVIRLRSLVPGVAQYAISTSSGFTTSFPYLRHGLASDVNITTDRISETSHGFSTGLPVRFDTTSGTAPSGLTSGTTYYAIRVNADSYQLSDTSTGAVAGLDIDITSLTGGGGFDVIPLALVTNPNTACFKWQASNDNTNFSDLAVSSVTYTAAGNTLWDLTSYPYRYLKIVFTAPAAGGLDLDVWFSGNTR